MPTLAVGTLDTSIERPIVGALAHTIVTVRPHHAHEHIDGSRRLLNAPHRFLLGKRCTNRPDYPVAILWGSGPNKATRWRGHGYSNRVTHPLGLMVPLGRYDRRPYTLWSFWHLLYNRLRPTTLASHYCVNNNVFQSYGGANDYVKSFVFS